MSHPIVSIVIATHDRHESLRQLMADLAAQTFPGFAREVIVVDDASAVPVTVEVGAALPQGTFRLLRVPHGGPGAARHAGARVAAGTVLIFVDDDMRLPPTFIESHVAHYRHTLEHVVVLGNIQPSDAIDAMPLFERYHARQLARMQQAMRAGTVPPRGVHLCTGNVSMRRRDYLEAGGFDPSLARSEDRELGVRLEQRGCRFVFGSDAVTYHGSDHRDVSVWRRRNELYGRADLIIARKHAGTPGIHPWRFWSLIPAAGRPLAMLTLVAPRLGHAAATAVLALAMRLDRMGATAAAVSLTGLVYCLDYFRGLRAEAGSFRGVFPRALSSSQVTAAPPRTASPAAPWRALRAAVRADHESTRTNRRKYHAQNVPAASLPANLVTKVGFQLLAMYRVMRFLDACRIPLAPMIVSRLIRHLYGAEIHWKTRIAPGVSVVHGVGLVLSHAAEVGPGCILFQGVTLGESLHPETGMAGAPRLEANVHVGPNATLIGPIVIGAGSKIMAGAVVMEDVPPNSLVRTPAVTITARTAPVRTASHAAALTPSMAM